MAPLQALCEGLEAIEQIAFEPESAVIEVRLHDFLPDSGGEAWVLSVLYSESHKHPLFAQRYPCLHFTVPVMELDPDHPQYHDMVAAFAVPVLDHQRFAHQPSFAWDPESGKVALYGQIRDYAQPEAMLAAQARDVFAECVMLLYFATFRIWQLRMRRSLGPDGDHAPIEVVRRRMMALLDPLGERL